MPKFSIAWTMATAIVHGEGGADSFTQLDLQDKKVLAPSNRITAKIDEPLNDMGMIGPAIAEREIMEVRVYSKLVNDLYGSPRNLMSLNALTKKFRDCAANVAKPLNDNNVEKVIQLTSRIAILSDVKEPVSLLV
jgi:2-methylcitrate dehydratase PrpD